MSTQGETAWAYLVVSSEAQAETLNHQRAWAKSLCLERSWTLTETFSGVSSGRDGTRGLFESLLEKLRSTNRSERPTRVLMIRLDRLGRGLGLEALASLAEIVRLGVIVHTRQDGDYALSRASDSILPLMRLVTGAIENEARRDKANAVYARRRASKSVVSNKRPYGLRVENGKDVPMEPQADAVRLAFELAANGFGLCAIGSRLNGVAADKVYANGRRHRTQWTTRRVAQLLSNPAYAGTVVDRDLFARARGLMNHAPTKVNSRHPWPLSGVLTCTCGRMLIGSMRGSPPDRVYRCTAKHVHGKHRTFGAKRLERGFLELLTQLAVSAKVMAEYASSPEATIAAESLVARRKGVEARIVNAESERARSWKLNAAGHVTDVELGRRLRELTNATKKAEKELRAIELEESREAALRSERATAEELVRKAAALWSSANVEQQQIAARALARAFGGFHVVEDGSIRQGPPLKPERFMRAS